METGDVITGSLCIKKYGERTGVLLERLKRLYKHTGLPYNHLFTRSLGLLEDIEYELASNNDTKQWEIKLVQDRIKIMQCVGGIVLYFHYNTLLRPQIQIIAKIITALTCDGHALLESPTGTGKTAAVVSAVCSWLKYISSKPGPKIQVFYLTRTHLQISQVLSELRKSCFILEVACLGSRSVTCPMIKRGSDIKSADSFCQSITSNKKNGNSDTCPYFNGLESKEFASMVHFRCRTLVHRILDNERKMDISGKYDINDGFWDIEELVDLCSNNNQYTSNECNKRSITSYFKKPSIIGCPYYTAKSLSTLADVVICPYSYVIDVTLPAVSEFIVKSALSAPKTELQKTLLERAIGFLPDPFFPVGARLSFANNVIIMDEAHNIEPFCKEIGSLDISLNQLQAAESWLRDFIFINKKNKKIKTPLNSIVKDNANYVYEFVSNLVTNVKNRSNSNSFVSWDRFDFKDDRLGGTLLFLKEFGITFIDSFVALASTYYITHFEGSSSLESDIISPFKRIILNLLSILVLVCKHAESYSVRIETASGTPHLRFFLLRAGVILDHISSNAKSLLLISGTLAPLNVTSASLGEFFVKRLKCTLEAGHVISKEQFSVFTLSTMPLYGGGVTSLDCIHKNLQNDKFLASLGTSIASLTNILPGNILIFFPNRDLIRRCLELWKDITFNKTNGSTVFDHISRSKKGLFIEPKTSLEFRDMVSKMSTQSFILMSAFRGHSSEGLNLSVQSLVLIGLPFANRTDPAVDACIRFATLTGLGDWYVIDAYRAINQSIGRCIRKKSDTGVVLLLDSRHSSHSNNLSSWLKPHITHVNDLDRLKQLIKTTAAYNTHHSNIDNIDYNSNITTPANNDNNQHSVKSACNSHNSNTDNVDCNTSTAHYNADSAITPRHTTLKKIRQ